MPVPRASGPTWLGRVQATLALPALVARRREAAAALAAIGEQARPDPAPYARAVVLARACLAAVPPPGVADESWVSQRLGASIAEVVNACEVLAASAASGVERAEAEVRRRVSLIRPLLKGERAAVFDQFGEPRCDCGPEPAAPEKVARAKEWIYVTGPTGPLDTYETLTFVWRGDKLVEQRQRVAHEQP